MGLETDQNIVDTYCLISKRVQGGSPANRDLAPLARFWNYKKNWKSAGVTEIGRKGSESFWDIITVAFDTFP